MVKDIPVEAPQAVTIAPEQGRELSVQVMDLMKSSLPSSASAGNLLDEVMQPPVVAPKGFPDLRISGTEKGEGTVKFESKDKCDLPPPSKAINFDELMVDLVVDGTLNEKNTDKLKEHVANASRGKSEPDFSALSELNRRLEKLGSPYRMQVKEDPTRQMLAIAYPDRVWDLRVLDKRSGLTTDFEENFYRRSTRRAEVDPWKEP